jgi:molybdopterin/thiamine biosynthesis adenylyltransferase
MKSSAEFYRERDLRTREYVGDDELNRLPVEVRIGSDVAMSAAGQMILLALTNQLARVHRSIALVLPREPVPISIDTGWEAATLHEAVLRLATAIDPFGEFRVAEESSDANTIRIGIGRDVGACDWYLGADRAIAFLSREPCRIDLRCNGTLRGAALSACLGSSAVFQRQLGMRVCPRTLSAWNYAEGANADYGPSDLVPLDIGRVLVVGAGAVGSALAYWLRVFGASGSWVVLDKDMVALHNTNRSLIFLPSHAGWFGGPVASKAELVAGLLPQGTPIREWFHEWAGTSGKFDVVLPLANEFDVRTRVAARNSTVVIHATTGQSWLSEIHRHITGQDDCVRCRMQDIKNPILGCSSAQVSSEQGSSTDAALPFLSAASGLMLVTALQRLQAGVLHLGRHNNWQWYFASEDRMARKHIWQCREGCSVVHPSRLRARLNAGARWAHLDGEAPVTQSAAACAG